VSFVGPSAEDDADAMRLLVEILLQPPLGDYFDEALVEVGGVEFDIAIHCLQDLIASCIHHDVNIQLLSDIFYYFLLAIDVETDEDSAVLVELHQVSNVSQSLLHHFLLLRKAELLFQKGVVYVEQIYSLRAALEFVIPHIWRVKQAVVPEDLSVESNIA
jgi:hypothetical protein